MLSKVFSHLINQSINPYILFNLPSVKILIILFKFRYIHDKAAYGYLAEVDGKVVRGYSHYKSIFTLIKPMLHSAFSLLCVGYEARRKLNVHATQIILPLLHFFFFSQNLIDLRSYSLIMKICCQNSIVISEKGNLKFSQHKSIAFSY